MPGRLYILIGTVILTIFFAGTLIAGSYRGNSESKIFHISGCRHYNCEACTVTLQSREEAIDKGFRPCKVCKP